MKKTLTLFLIGFFIAFSQKAQKVKTEVGNSNPVNLKKQYHYDTVPNDPLHARIYKLENGLTVYMSVYKNAPRVQTYIAVRAGSKNDPANNTGLAHYLEHMVFKGTDQYGTKNYALEAPELIKIENLYEIYRTTKEDEKRKNLYHQIDSISGVAAKYAIANEYDKMTAAIGAKGTNAYTWVDQTVYINDIPSNQVNKWIEIEAERFRNPVLRLFHTELEAVYEEKNRSLDNDGNKAWEAMLAGLWQKHTYGTQTTIGTIDHLKNPSIKEIKKYYDSYYVPNNMAICMSGDFNPDEAIREIDEKFGLWKSKPVPSFIVAKEDPILHPTVKEVTGPDAENILLGFRFNGGAGSKDADMLTLVSKILYNNNAGLIDLNLNQKQTVLGAYSAELIFNDYSAHLLSGSPKEGQTLDQVKDLLLEQIELIKKGEFQDWMLSAIINDLKLQKIKENENNSSRADHFVSSFIAGTSWAEHVNTIDRLSKITKQEIVDFVKKNYQNNYVVVYKKTGEDKNVPKITKPEITPVDVNRDDQSPFLKNIVAAPFKAIEPVFIDYKKDIQGSVLKSEIPLLYTENKENQTFNLYYNFSLGSNHNKKLPLAVQYLDFIGTSKYSAAQIREEFFKLGCTFYVYASEDHSYVSLSGLSENMGKALALFEEFLENAKPNQEALNNLISNILKERQDAKLNKQAILFQAMYPYAVYGPKSPATNVLSEKELKDLKPEDLVSLSKELLSYQHRILYYGPEKQVVLQSILNKLHKTPPQLKRIPEPIQFVELEPTNNVYVVDYDMKQAEVLMLSKEESYNKQNEASVQLFNEYFGGNMSSVVFQEIRESKALAYSVYATYTTPKTKEKPHFLHAYIGTQADKLPEAMQSMMELLNEMPKSQILFDASKEAIIQKIRSQRITQENILMDYERAQKLGQDNDIRKDIFEKVSSYTLNDLKVFHEQYVKNRKYTIMVLGKKENLDLKTLEKYGKVQFLTLEDVFGY